MNLEYYIDTVKFELTGGILESEIGDEGYARIVNMSLQELNRYYSGTQLIQVPGERCIDLAKLEEENNIKINSVSTLYRTAPADGGLTTSSSSDPMAISQWNMCNNFYSYGTNRWVYNYMAYNTANQIANTISTDLDFKEDKIGRKLYVNYNRDLKNGLTIEYIPRLTTVDEVVGDYWVNILLKLSLAYAKITLGRIRTRYTQTDALWTQDGDKLLEEGKSELDAIRERLQAQANYFYPVD